MEKRFEEEKEEEREEREEREREIVSKRRVHLSARLVRSVSLALLSPLLATGKDSEHIRSLHAVVSQMLHSSMHW